MPIIAGSTPACAHDTIRHSGCKDLHFASSALINTHTAAPSFNPEINIKVTSKMLTKRMNKILLQIKYAIHWHHSLVHAYLNVNLNAWYVKPVKSYEKNSSSKAKIKIPTKSFWSPDIFFLLMGLKHKVQSLENQNTNQSNLMRFLQSLFLTRLLQKLVGVSVAPLWNNQAVEIRPY